MNTLTMALAAALLAGSAPEKVSGEVEQRLDLSGEWKGTYAWPNGLGRARLAGGYLYVEQRSGGAWKCRICITHDGGNRIRVRLQDNLLAVGSYEEVKGCIFLFFQPGARGHAQANLIIRRLQPRK